MTLALFTHPACFGHRTPPGHPERVDRLRAVLGALDEEAFPDLDRRAAPLAEVADVERVHLPDYVRLIASGEPEDPEEWRALDPDTSMSSGSVEAAMRAAGAVCAAVDGVIAGDFDRAFCAVRPPGHHAEQARAMGFCLFNNIGVAAMRAKAVHGLERVAIVDFDVHHGNGSQDLAYREPWLFFASIHEGGIYPGTGLARETGPDDNVVNAPAPHGCMGPTWRELIAERILPQLKAYAPELVLISAGFDGHAADPLAGLMLDADDFAWATTAICEAAEPSSQGRVVSTLEGGYDLDALAASAAAHVRALQG
jgi:acetoin utilization deacetylase AcuC-like enzyme